MQIVITGASKGIGLACAEIFLGENKNHTIILSARDGKYLDEVATELQSKYSHATIHHFACDLSVKKEITAFAAFVEQIDATDILINNAGIFVPGSCYDEPDGQLELIINNNLYSAYHLTRALLPKMIAQQSGHIFNICSIASLTAYSNGGAYSISKFALSGFSKNLREELKPFGIKVSSVYPGATMTNSWAGLDIDPARIMEAQDIAKMIYAATQLSPQAVMEDIVLRPQLGDL